MLIQVGVASFPLSFLRLFIVCVFVCMRVCAGTAPCLRLCSSRKRRHLFKWKLIGFYYQSLSHTSREWFNKANSSQSYRTLIIQCVFVSECVCVLCHTATTHLQQHSSVVLCFLSPSSLFFLLRFLSLQLAVKWFCNRRGALALPSLLSLERCIHAELIV